MSCQSLTINRLTKLSVNHYSTYICKQCQQYFK
ncbi:zinc finger domain-containing protein [Pedobacter helvus]|uniref:Zinc finger domain-containing protein n=1 Tax=Pedobacter helvus TaxID=2563444 RepID=A0ABW9JIW5_9SPHI